MDDRTCNVDTLGTGGWPIHGQIGAARLEGYGALPVVRKYGQGRTEGGQRELVARTIVWETRS